MTKELPQTHWTLLPADAAIVDALSAATGLSRTTARVLVTRGVSTAEEVDRFLSPSLERDWEDPLAIPGMADVADMVAAAVRAGEHIVVFGDFDLDGISS